VFAYGGPSGGGRLNVKLRRILAPQAELSSTSSTFSAVLPPLRCCPEPSSSSLSSPVSKLNAEGLVLCDCLGEDCDEGPEGKRGPMSATGVPTMDVSVPRRRRPPSKPWAIKASRGSWVSNGERNGENGETGGGACRAISCSSSIKISGPNCGTSVMRCALFLSMCFLNFLDQYLYTY
jgi:hypothetical protein